MRYIRYIYASLLWALPSFVFGADSGGLVPCSGPDCNFCSLAVLADRVINFLFAILILAAVLVLVVAGFKLVTSQGNEHAWGEAKKMVTNVVIGFVIVLSAWLIVDTVIKAIANRGDNGGVDFGMWNQISDVQCDAPTTSAPDTTMYCSNSNDGNYVLTVPSSATCDAQRQQIIAQHQSVVMNACHVCTSADYGN